MLSARSAVEPGGLFVGIPYVREQGKFMYVIKRQRGDTTEWLLSRAPEDWGVRDGAMLFETRREAQRAAVGIKLSGDWSIDPGFVPPLAPRVIPPT